MKYLLDTSVWYRGLVHPETIPNKLQKILADSEEAFGISDISLWEIGQKNQLGKLHLGMDLSVWLETACSINVTILPMTPKVISATMKLLDLPTRDPADEIILGTAQVHNLTLLTLDRALKDYPFAKVEYFRPSNVKK